MAQDRSDPTGEGRERRITAAFVELTGALGDDFDIVVYLCVLTRLCVGLLSVTAAGVLLADDSGRLLATATSDESTRLLGLIEADDEEGLGPPCFRSGVPVANAGLDPAATRWSRLSAHARACGYTTAHALPMRLRHTVVGTLFLFAETADLLADADFDLGRAMAEAATLKILNQRTLACGVEATAQLQQALTSRIVIEQAKGILAERMQIHVDEAFAALRGHARDHNLPLSAVARAVAEGDDLGDTHKYLR